MLGIIDWGIGGISIYKLMKKRIGNLPIVYFSDTGATPYGKMARRELASRLDAVITFLKIKGVTRLIIGCNAASTAIPDLSEHHIPIEGIIDAAVSVAATARPERLSVIGGRRTVLSGVYRKAFAKRGIKIEQRIAQPLSGMIEAGDISSKSLRDQAERILGPVRNSSHILLACTHYPAIEPVLREFVSPTTIFIDPAEAVLETILKWKMEVGGEDRFLTTGDRTQMVRSAHIAFGTMIGKAEMVRI